MQFAYYGLFLLVLTIFIFVFHYLRVRNHKEYYVFFVVFLWVTAFITGQFNYKLFISLEWLGRISIRYSSSIYVLIFTSILLVYVLEGVRETRNLIAVSVLTQLFLGFLQFFMGQTIVDIVPKEYTYSAKLLFLPSFNRMVVSLGATIIDLFFAAFIFQVLVNMTKKVPTFLWLVVALLLTITLDAVMFIAGTRIDIFFKTLASHLVYKSAIVLFLAAPLGAYISWFKKQGKLDMNRGSLDIFRRIEELEEDLSVANQKLREYAETLEEKVEQRTKELQEANSELLDYHRMAERDMKMAVTVQSNLIPKDYADKDNWDISVTYKPMSGVSGDFYDFYEKDGKMLGLGIFDVSGHGIASGLVTVLAKPIVYRVFTKMRKAKLSNVLSVVNNHLIKEINNIDNYLTGLLLRFDKDKVEYVNAGHTDIMHRSKKGKISIIDRKDVSWKGVFLGIDGMDAEYKVLRFAMQKGDTLLLYSDCLIESINTDREEYGMARLKQAYENAPKDKSEKIMQYILDDFYQFVGRQKLKDDLTIIILQRK